MLQWCSLKRGKRRKHKEVSHWVEYSGISNVEFDHNRCEIKKINGLEMPIAGKG